MTDTTPPPTPSWQSHADAADLALDQGDLTAARWAIEAALNDVIPVKIQLLQAELHRRDGRIAEAERQLRITAARNRGNFWPMFRLAELLLEQNRLTEAAETLDAGRGRGEATRHKPFLALDVILRERLGQPNALAQALAACLDHPPMRFDPAPPLRALTSLPGGVALAMPLYHRALDANPAHADLRADFIALLTGRCPPGEAVSGLSLLLDSADTADAVRAVALPLARIHRQLGQQDAEEAVLQRLARAAPTDTELLRHVFTTQMVSADAETLNRITAALKGRVPDRVYTELSAQVAIALMAFDTAVALLRPLRAPAKPPHVAQMQATALIGQGRYALALRYLAACARRWPKARGLCSYRIIWAMKLGQLEVAEAAIESGKDSLAPGEIAGHRMRLAGMRNDLPGAMEHYADLRRLGQLTLPHRVIMAKLIYGLADIARLDEIYAAIGNPLGETGKLLHRSGLAGTMSLELQLEHRDYSARGGFDTLEDWRQARPGSVVAAIRLIDAWRAQTPPMAQAGEAVPRRIFQYWDKPEPPEIVQRMTQSWAGAEGFSHELWTRAQAVAFLRESLGPRWVRALEMARNPAEESDLLRLCLLAKFGGVWADADDRLHGDLGGLLEETAGLVIYREALGGALGNNFIAAPPGHPAVILAAKMVKQALLDRTAELAWGKTGPGVLTRAVAHYLVQTDVSRAEFPLTIIENDRLARVVAMHNPVRYKILPSHWTAESTRPSQTEIWPALLDALENLS
ncbi:glycosyltransferase [Primorskyibacter sp. 2E107]|uniref:glycosyltransferase n=1 Tax=Primorskyibacter sp. 2E107 TaxID=3403458 RepID=UPI003AF702C3